MMRLIILLAAFGLTACEEVARIDSGVCAGIKEPTSALRGALERNAEKTPPDVGEAGTDVVLGLEAGCGWR